MALLGNICKDTSTGLCLQPEQYFCHGLALLGQ
uniref:Uncharacterized protein n=1 Tax=Rhizophora mucronata TaxID=61149 RepID=A0A2P2J2P4_RHIMU